MSNPNPGNIQPFEWLTSPESIGGFVREHVMSGDNGETNIDGKEEAVDGSNNDSENTFDTSSKARSAMHIGCGSSTVGEYLVRELGFAKVVNVDKDRETLEGMAERWSQMTKLANKCHADGDEKKDDDEEEDKSNATNEPLVLTPTTTSITPTTDPMEFWCLDYTCQTLPDHYAETFDLVVDKSTLDCTLCSDCSATAAFLVEIYRTLKASGGVYLVISFHELDLILPLLRDLPGAHWTVACTTMERQVECLVSNANGVSASALPSNATSDDGGGNGVSRKPLNVLIARKKDDVQTPSLPLIMEEVVRHVQDVNDRWFQDEQPLLTPERIEDLKRAFLNSDGDDQEAPGTHSDSKRLSLEEAYGVMFTDAEREHLTYEHFLEDWEAFCDEEEGQQQQEKDGHDQVSENITRETVCYELALGFLRANQ